MSQTLEFREKRNSQLFFNGLVFVPQQIILGPSTTAPEEQGCCNGERARLSHQCGPFSIPAWCHMCVEFGLDSRLAPRVFLRVLQFSSRQKNQHFKFQFDQGKGPL